LNVFVWIFEEINKLGDLSLCLVHSSNITEDGFDIFRFNRFIFMHFEHLSDSSLAHTSTFETASDLPRNKANKAKHQ